MRQSKPLAGPATFEDLCSEHAERVIRLARLLGVSEPELDDVAQEVWLDVHRSLSKYDASKGTARAWIAGIVRNAVRDWKRTRRRHPELCAPTDEEPPDPRTLEPAADAARAERHAALQAFVERAIPNEDRREALLLHELEGMTVEEVASATGVTRRTARWRIEMARSNLKKAAESLSDEEREKMRAVVLPLGGVDGILRALRETQPPVPQEHLARVWDRVVERIEAGGGNIHDRLGSPPPRASAAPPKSYAFTRPQLAGTLGGVFLLGGLSGATVHGWLSPRAEATTTIAAAEVRPTLFLSADVAPEPAPTASTTAPTRASARPAAVPWESESWMLDHARRSKPEEALRLAEQHAQRFPRSRYGAEREEIAIRALMKLGRQAEAEDRASRLLQSAPEMRPALEALMGRSLF